MKGVAIFFIITTIGYYIFAAITMIVFLWFLYDLINFHIKDRLLKRHGFKFIEGLPGRVAFEFQSAYIKGNKSIRAKDAYRRSYKRLKAWCEEK